MIVNNNKHKWHQVIDNNLVMIHHQINWHLENRVYVNRVYVNRVLGILNDHPIPLIGILLSLRMNLNVFWIRRINIHQLIRYQNTWRMLNLRSRNMWNRIGTNIDLVTIWIDMCHLNRLLPNINTSNHVIPLNSEDWYPVHWIQADNSQSLQLIGRIWIWMRLPIHS